MVKVFITGGTGFIGTRLVKALIAEGHTVTVLSRRTESHLNKLDVTVLNGSFDDSDLLAAAAHEADAVFHLGFDHDFSKVAESCAQDLRVVKTLIGALSGSGKLLVNTSVTIAAGDTGDALGKETQLVPSPRTESEVITAKANEHGVRGVVARIPLFVYPNSSRGFYFTMYKAAEQKGFSSYIGAGANKLCVLHVDDAVRAYMSFLTHRDAHGVYNFAGQNGITNREMAEIIAARLNCKTVSVSLEEAQNLFGPFIAHCSSMNNQADCSKALKELNWQPLHLDFQEVV